MAIQDFATYANKKKKVFHEIQEHCEVLRNINDNLLKFSLYSGHRLICQNCPVLNQLYLTGILKNG